MSINKIIHPVAAKNKTPQTRLIEVVELIADNLTTGKTFRAKTHTTKLAQILYDLNYYITTHVNKVENHCRILLITMSELKKYDSARYENEWREVLTAAYVTIKCGTRDFMYEFNHSNPEYQCIISLLFLNLRLVGRAKAMHLAKHTGSFEKLVSLSEKELQCIPNIGSKVVEALYPSLGPYRTDLPTKSGIANRSEYCLSTRTHNKSKY